MVSYHISYGEPPRRFDGRKLLGILGILLALLVLAAIAYGIYWLVTDDSVDLSLPDFAAVADGDEAVSLNEIFAALYQSNTNTVFLVDSSRSIEDGGNLPVVKQALLDVALPYVDAESGEAAENSNVALMTFTDQTETPVEMASLEKPQALREWLAAVNGMGTQDRPAYIHDAVRDAHSLLADVDPGERDSRINVIVLLTDGFDGGFTIVDPASAAPCPDSAGDPCIRASDGAGGETFIQFEPADLKPCPEQFGVALGMGCIESSSEMEQAELLKLLKSDDVPNLIVHTVGFGEEADQTLLRLLAQAGTHEGQYVYADH